MSSIRLLPFPPPYRAAVAISNDVDDLWDPSGWWDFLRFLNTDEQTPHGRGLGLEVGDSFWLWSDDPEEQPASYFEGLTERRSRFAPFIATLGRAGYLDTLHTYGNFSRFGGFRREHARVAAHTLREEGFVPRVWVNHGDGGYDFQNLWAGWGDACHAPEKRGVPVPEYHLDLTRDLGVRYVWIGELTTIPGQARALGLRDWTDRQSPLRRESVGWLRREISRRIAYREAHSAFPNYATLRNRLLTPLSMRDGATIQTFVRYGDHRRANFSDLEWLLRPDFLDALERSAGCSIVFVHWSKHPGRSFENLDPRALERLRDLSRRAREQRLWVTTTARLLAYVEARSAVRSRVVERGAQIEIHLDADPLPDGRQLTAADLAGLSFAAPDPGRVALYWKGASVPIDRVPGRSEAIWIPLAALHFPPPPECGAAS